MKDTFRIVTIVLITVVILFAGVLVVWTVQQKPASNPAATQPS